MNFNFNTELVNTYTNNSQRIRIMSEHWVAQNIFCPICGNFHINSVANNSPVADFICENCGEIYELKSKNKKIGKKIVDGAYSTMIERIISANNPNLFVMQYSDNLQVINLTLIPKFFFVPSIIEKRKPLSEKAHRAGWIGCNILYSEIPEQGKVEIINNQKIADRKTVIDKYAKLKKLQTDNIENRGWILDVLACVNTISKINFSLQDMYKFADELQAKHIDNHNIKAKIRQQLQVLRDKGVINFLGDGHYQKIL